MEAKELKNILVNFYAAAYDLKRAFKAVYNGADIDDILKLADYADFMLMLNVLNKHYESIKKTESEK